MSVKLKTDGEFEIKVSKDGDFEAWKDGEMVTRSSTMEGLEKYIAKARRVGKVKINVPFVHVNYGTGEITDGFVYGRHARNGQWLVSINGEKDSQSFYSSRGYIKSLSDEEREELKRLTAEKRAADEAFGEFLESREYKGFVEIVRKTWRDAGGEE